MNLRNLKGGYSIGLDMGTGSVGWAVTDEEGRLLHFKKQPTWGSRLFDSAETAAAARTPRGQRRRYVRRRWRLDLLQNLMQEEIEKVDPDFLLRLRQSRLVQSDPNKTTSTYRWPIFNDSDFTEIDYYNQFPTIYHLRKYLMETEEQADIRLVYLALHNIVKCRGNFLREGQTLSAKSAKPDDAVEAFAAALSAWCEGREGECDPIEVDDIVAALTAKGMNNSERKDAIADLLPVSFGDRALDKKLKKALATAMVGLKAEFKDIFGEFAAEKTKISLSSDEEVDALRESCPDDCKDLFEALCGVHSAYVLQGLLSHAPGQTISANMIAKYNRYGSDLKTLKALVREYKDARTYNEFFRGPLYSDKSGYSVAESKGYTRYNLGKTSYDDFAKEVKKLFAGTAAEGDPRYEDMLEAFENQRFLRRLKTSDNGSIYYQLHLEEMKAILDNQGRFYPVLKEQREKLLSLVTFRIPYYVGPLTRKNARLDAHGKARFAWSERKEGTENAVITPWNWENVIDKGKSAENFIKRMTGICTYLQGEDVLPKCSLLYEEFCVLNELNGMRWTVDGDNEQRFDEEQRRGIVKEFRTRPGRITNKKIGDWLVQNGFDRAPKVMGGQSDSGLESKFSSYAFFANLLGVDEIAQTDYPMVEEIILWSTLFEDRSILREKLEETYGPAGNGRLDADQIKAICKKRFTGWGRLSEKFLTGLKVDTQLDEKSIMDILREGDPNADVRRGRAMVLMEILHDDKLGFQKEIDAFNCAYFEQAGDALGVNDLPGSPAVRRSLNQAIRIVDEIAGIAGKAPSSIFIEVTRDEDAKKKGNRTKRRYDRIKEALVAFKEQDPRWTKRVISELKDISPDALDERLTLYFMQNGKCLYSGKPINIAQLSNAGLYEVDHIIPRSYIKDDSFENKALVLRAENQRKTDAMLLDPAIRRRMAGYWRALHDAGLIGDKKFKNLMRSSINDDAMRGFIARQLVETSQMVKFAQSLLSVKYPDTKVVPVKANMSHNLRDAAGFVKCREANDFHHAHDAFLACRIGLFIMKWHPGIYDRPIAYAHAMRKYVQEQAKEFNIRHEAPGSSGFVVGSFLGNHVDDETGELWEGAAEVEDIRRALNYRQCYITRMPMENSGAFWDATIYSPRDPKMGPKLSLRLKADLDVKDYGGYSRTQFAYFFIYEARDKKGRTVFRFAEVPVWLAPRIRKDESALDQYARELAEGEKLEFVGIQRAKILKKQLIEVDGERLMITGAKEVRNASEIAFNLQEVALLERHVRKMRGEPYLHIPTESCADGLLNTLSKSFPFAKRVLTQIDYDKINVNAKSLNSDEKEELAIRITALINATSNMVDLSLAGGPKCAGCMRVTHSKLLTDPGTDYYIIDQSVTGMFERRTRVGL